MPKPISLEDAIDLFPSCENQVNGIMVPVPKLRALARQWFGKADEQSMDVAAGHVLLTLARAYVKQNLRYRWRPIREIHEDYGPCVAIDINDPGYQEIVSNLYKDYDETQWTHFAQLPELTNTEAERLIAELEVTKCGAAEE